MPPEPDGCPADGPGPLQARDGPRRSGAFPCPPPAEPGPRARVRAGTAWLVVVIAPIYCMVLASFRSQGNYLTENPWLPKGGLTLGEYGTVFGAGFGRYLLNSVIVTAVCIALTVSTCLGAAFRIVRSTRAASGSFRILLLGLTKLEGQYAINVPP